MWKEVQDMFFEILGLVMATGIMITALTLATVFVTLFFGVY